MIAVVALDRGMEGAASLAFAGGFALALALVVATAAAARAIARRRAER